MSVAQVVASGPERGRVRVATSGAKRNWWLRVPGAQVPAPAGPGTRRKLGAGRFTGKTARYGARPLQKMAHFALQGFAMAAYSSAAITSL